MQIGKGKIEEAATKMQAKAVEDRPFSHQHATLARRTEREGRAATEVLKLCSPCRLGYNSAGWPTHPRGTCQIRPLRQHTAGCVCGGGWTNFRKNLLFALGTPIRTASGGFARRPIPRDARIQAKSQNAAAWRGSEQICVH
mmetsp:Transcript_29178/g.76574  ORF Transcript_29178/g.76574 Transcript_29178/m.76574 type:complete len:141 (-) Transcript_29178:272-694(-)